MSNSVYSFELGPLGLLLVPIHGLGSVLTTHERFWESGSFSNRIVNLNTEELRSMWDQRNSRQTNRMSFTSNTRLLLLNLGWLKNNESNFCKTSNFSSHTHTHTHTRTYIYIHIYIITFILFNWRKQLPKNIASNI